MTSGTATTANETAARIPVGIWTEYPVGERWTNEGMTRLLGFLIEGIATDGRYVFRIVVPDSIRQEAEADLLTLKAKLNLDYTLHSPHNLGQSASNLSELVDFANRWVEVDGWLSIFPHFDLAAGLEKPLAVIFPDAIPKTFHQFSEIAWGPKGEHLSWEGRVRRSVESADRLITFSRHVRDNQLVPLFGVSPDKVVVVPHASPDLLGSLPFLTARQRTPQSLALAGTLLREHAAIQGWNYLRDYPFEQAPYLAVSTQDRVTKDILLILHATLRLVREQRLNLKTMATAIWHYGADWTPLPAMVDQQSAHRDLVSVPDLPREQHAAFFHCAQLAVHTSMFEGGHAPFPFYEAVSVGTPCLMARGPHLDELLEEEPGLAPFLFDSNNADGLAQLIVRTLADREAALAAQAEIYERLRQRRWSDVSVAYAQAAVGLQPRAEGTGK